MASPSHQVPSILQLLSMMKDRRVSELEVAADFDSEWGMFCLLSEMLSTIVTNKMTSEGEEDQLDRLKRDFESLSRDDERVKFVLERPEYCQIVRHFSRQFVSERQHHHQPSTRKSGEKSQKVRQEGNSLFRQERYLDAVNKYSEALRWSPTDDDLSVIYGNRSAGYFFLGEYQLSLRDIELAGKLGLPDKKKEVILSRQEKCLKFLSMNGGRKISRQKSLENIIYESRVIHESSLDIPSASAALSKMSTPEKGNHLVVSRDVNQEEFLIKERPFSYWLRPSQYPDYCYECLEPFHLSWSLPCPTCSRVAFCSDACISSSHHRLECPIFDMLYNFSKVHLAFKILSKSGHPAIKSDFRSSLDAGNVDHLVAHSKEFPFDIAINMTLGSLFMAITLANLSVIDEDSVAIVASDLLTNIFRLNVNGIQIVHQELTFPEEEGANHLTSFRIVERKANIGYGLYPTSSLMNHSCHNVVKSYFRGCEIAFTACKDMKAGEEVTFNYGPHYKVTSKEERRKLLKELYFFDCDCSACRHDWR